MPTTQITLPPPPSQDSTLSQAERRYLTQVQKLLPLNKADTSSGPYAESAPNQGSGESLQGREMVYLKVSADGNVFTLNNVQGGPYILAAQYDGLRIHFDGAVWWKVP